MDLALALTLALALARVPMHRLLFFFGHGKALPIKCTSMCMLACSRLHRMPRQTPLTMQQIGAVLETWKPDQECNALEKLCYTFFHGSAIMRVLHFECSSQVFSAEQYEGVQLTCLNTDSDNFLFTMGKMPHYGSRHGWS